MKVGKHGNNLGIHLPRKLVKELGLKVGDYIEITVKKTSAIELPSKSEAQKEQVN